MRLSRLAVLPLIAGAAIALTACGDKTPTGSPLQGGGNPQVQTGAKVDMCGVLTLERAKKLIGEDAKQDANDIGECSYNADSTANSVTIKAENDPDGTQWDLTRKIGGEAQKVDGLGDDAFYRPGLQTLYVRKAPVNLDIQVVTGPESRLDEQKKLAAEILK